jgi:hypothetical protein
MTLLSFVKTILVFVLPFCCRAEIQNFSILLPPTELYIHYADGYLRGPDASIDLSALTFTAISSSFSNRSAAVVAAALNNASAPNDTLYPGDGQDDMSAGNPPLRKLDGGVEVGGTYLDIVAFPLPAQCANARNGCDWTQLGVGGKLADGSLRWCCGQDAVDGGLCTSTTGYGRLIVDLNKFQGVQRSVAVPQQGVMSKQLKAGMLQLQKTDRYVVVFSNCNEGGREIIVSGNAIWKSQHGYLPGELFEYMYFYDALWICYIILFVWFFLLMKKNSESRIPIEKWILMTIILGTAELTIRTIDYHVWNAAGVRENFLSYLGILMGNMKHGISRCLIVMVSLGWGVVRDSLGSTMPKIVILGSIYVGIAAARDLMIDFAVEDMQTLAYNKEVELFDVATILTFCVAAVDVIFIMWILDALNGTMQYLQNMSQTRKLERYLKLRTLFLFSILFATIWAVFSLVDTYDEDGIVREEHEWTVEAATEVNYFFVLVGVAWLWRPNPAAKEYAYAMELPASNGDGGAELELTGGVPSAMDDDDEHDMRFQIDEAEHA